MPNSFALLLVVTAAAAISGGLIALLWPRLTRYAVAQPTKRSSHSKPTPQSGGIAVIIGTTCLAGSAILAFGLAADTARELALVFAATIFIASVGALDDVRDLSVNVRLGCQFAAFALVLLALPMDLRIAPALPWWVERSALLFGGLWFINLTNFMDGIDWITTVETICITAGLMILGIWGELPLQATIVAAALCGAIVGFAPYNRPPAKLFLGDVGSLPIGLLIAWMLILLAGNGHLAAALLLPLYYLCDSTLTLLRRIAARKPIWHAHRDHFYQRAFDRGMSATQIVARVLAVNLLLLALACTAVAARSAAISCAAVICGIIAVGGLLKSFATNRGYDHDEASAR